MTSATGAVAGRFLAEIWRAAGGGEQALATVDFTGPGALPGAFAVTDLAAASLAAAGLAVSEFIAARTGLAPRVRADRRLASWWFMTSLRPQGWKQAPTWDAIAGDYACSDGWIRLHTNAPHHRAAALEVLGVAADKKSVAAAVGRWRAEDLENTVLDRGGCAAQMRTLAEWAAHPQGQAVNAEPLLWQSSRRGGTPLARDLDPSRPLRGIRVLDLTRILAGPVATRFLAGYGADVLRIDPMAWDEPAIAAEVTLGKRCARLDLRDPQGKARFEQLLQHADVLVHGYRADALDRLGLGAEHRRRLNPGLVDVALDAYGWTGPWRHRRGFDSLVQMSTGIADAGMRAAGARTPTPLPAQALDHATGYVLATAAIRGLTARFANGSGSETRASLARMAALLASAEASPGQAGFAPETPDDLAERIEATAWGPARRLRPPVAVENAAMQWDRPACLLGSSAAQW